MPPDPTPAAAVVPLDARGVAYRIATEVQGGDALTVGWKRVRDIAERQIADALIGGLCRELRALRLVADAAENVCVSVDSNRIAARYVLRDALRAAGRMGGG